MRRERRAANIRRMAQRSPSVEVEINELILRGFPASECYAIGEALSHELDRLFVEAGARHLISSETHLPAINAGNINVTAPAQPDLIGAQVARAVYSGLNNLDRRKS